MMLPMAIQDAAISDGYVNHPHLARLTDTSDYDYVGGLEALMKGLYSRQLLESLPILAVIGKNSADCLLNIYDSTNDLVLTGTSFSAGKGLGGASGLYATGITSTKKLTNMTPDLAVDTNIGVYFQTAVAKDAGFLFFRLATADKDGSSNYLFTTDDGTDITTVMFNAKVDNVGVAGATMDGKKGAYSLRAKASISDTVYISSGGVAYTITPTTISGLLGRDTRVMFVGLDTGTPPSGSFVQSPDSYYASAFWYGSYIDTDTYDNDFYPLILSYLTAVGAN